MHYHASQPSRLAFYFEFSALYSGIGAQDENVALQRPSAVSRHRTQ